MTIAAGLLYNGGVLMCADTMMSSVTTTAYESKLKGYRLDDGLVVFGLAGYTTFAQSAIQECRIALSRTPSKARTHEEIASLLKPILARSFTTQFLKPKLDWANYGYELVVTIYSSLNGPALYYSDYTGFAKTETRTKSFSANFTPLFLTPVRRSTIQP